MYILYIIYIVLYTKICHWILLEMNPFFVSAVQGFWSSWHLSRRRTLRGQWPVRSWQHAPRARGVVGRLPPISPSVEGAERAGRHEEMPCLRNIVSTQGPQRCAERLSYWQHRSGTWCPATWWSIWTEAFALRSPSIESRGWWGRWRSRCIERSFFLLNEVVCLILVLIFPVLKEPAIQWKVLPIYRLGVPRLPVPQWANVAAICTLHIQRACAVLRSLQCALFYS